MFKKFLIILAITAIILITALTALGIYFLDINRYTPVLEKHLSEFVGHQVSIERVNVSWTGDIALSLDGIVIHSDNSEDSLVLAKARAVSATLEWRPLIDKKIIIKQIKIIHPVVLVAKTLKKNIVIQGLDMESNTHKPMQKLVLGDWSIEEVQIESVVIKDAEVEYKDLGQAEVLSMGIQDLDAEFIEPTWDRPTEFNLSAALLGPKKNLEAKGSITVPKMGKGKIDYDVNMTLTKGELKVKNIDEAFRKLVFNAQMKPQSMQVHKLSTDIAGGHVDIQGHMENHLTPNPISTFELNATQLSLDNLMPRTHLYKPRVIGDLGIRFSGQVIGKDKPSLLRSLAGQGQVSLNEGAIININLLRMLFDKLMSVPQVTVEGLNAYLPPQYAEILNRQYTALYPIQLDVTAGNGGVYIRNLHLATEGFEIFGQGQIGFMGDVYFDTTMVMSQDLSQALIAGIPNFQLAADQYGRLSLPVNISGYMNQLNIQPNTQHIISRLIESKGSELIGQFLQ